LAYSVREVLEIRVKHCRLLFAAIAALLLPALHLHAQVTAVAAQTEDPDYSNRWDVFGGAQYSHSNPSPGDQMKAINLTGWNATLTYWARPAFGIEATTRNLYGTIDVPPQAAGYDITNYPMSEHLFLFGPTARFIRRPKFDAGMHLAIGAAYGIFDDFNTNPYSIRPLTLDIYDDKLAFGLAVGAFSDYNVTPKWSVRVYTDWQPTHYGYSRQDEFAGALGIVYKFGWRGAH
jgi:hypothetical protein